VVELLLFAVTLMMIGCPASGVNEALSRTVATLVVSEIAAKSEVGAKAATRTPSAVAEAEPPAFVAVTTHVRDVTAPAGVYALESVPAFTPSSFH
jgi:hypothetical protein